MKILERYTLRAYLGPLFWCLGVFVGLYLVLDLLGHLDEILRYKVPTPLLLTYYGTMVPLIFVKVAPFACLIAALYTLSHLNRHLELMAMRASGIGPWAIVRPLLWTGALMSLAVLLVNETIAPQAAVTTHTIKVNRLEQAPDPKKPHRVLRQIQHLAAYGEGHTLLYAQLFDPVEKRLAGIVILQHGANLRLVRKVTAESAVWTGSRWRFLDGTILHYDAQGHAVGRPVPYESKFIQAGDRPEVLERAEFQAAFMNMRDLMRYMKNLKSAGSRTVRALAIELYAKPIAALSCLVLTLIGIPFAVQSARGGAMLSLGIGLGVGLAFYACHALMMALGKGGVLPPLISVSLAPVGFTIFGVRMTRKRLA